jgi:UMF1 family MFS transporter
MFNKKIFAWSMYDLANTSFYTLIVTVFFPVIVKQLGGTEFQIGLAMGIASFASAFLVPLIGGMSDALKIKKPFIILFTILTIIFTVIIAYCSLALVLIFGLLATLFYHASLDIYDSMLADISNKNNYGKVSGIGTAFGYVGALLCLLMASFILNQFGWESELGAKMIFPATGVFFFVFSLPLFFMIQDAKVRARAISWGIKKSFLEIKRTLTEVKKYRNVLLFLLSSLIYVDGLSTAIIFLYLYGKEVLDIGVKEFFPVYGLMAGSAIAGSLLFGFISDRLGPKKSLISALALWIGIIAMLVLKSNYLTYMATGIAGGALLGAVWTVTRPMLIKIAPKSKLAELFGFQGLTEKLGGLFGPVIFGALATWLNYTAALVSILIFFIAGLAMLLYVKE